MAIYKRDIVDINLETGNIHRSFLNHTIGYKDNAADHFGIRTFRNGEPVDLTGVSVQGVFMPPQGDPIAITSGNIVDGNVAEVVLPQACYNYNGQFTLAIKLVDGTNSITGTMRIVDGVVDNTHASGTVAPTSAVPTYQEILSTYDAMVAATAAANGAIAAAYSSSSTYAVGDYCIHDGGLYRCTTAITTAEAWTAAHWTAAKIGPDVSNLKSALNFDEYLINNGTYTIKASDLESGQWSYSTKANNTARARTKNLLPVRAGMTIAYTNTTFDTYFGVLETPTSPTYIQAIGWITNSIGTISITQDGWLTFIIRNHADTTANVNPADYNSVVTIRSDLWNNVNLVAAGCEGDEPIFYRILSDKTALGVSYTWDKDKGRYHITGTKEDGYAFYNVYNPFPVTPGDKYYLTLYKESNNVTVSVYGYTSNNTLIAISEGILDELTLITVPDNCAVMWARINIISGANLDEYANLWFTKSYFGKPADYMSLKYHINALPSCDLNNVVTENGAWLLIDSNQYTNLPDFTPYSYGVGFFEVKKFFSGWTLQIITAIDASGFVMRRKNSAGFTEWKEIKTANTYNNTYVTEHYDNTYNIECSPTINTDTNNYLASTGDTTDRTGDIQTMLNTNGICHLGPGIFFTTGITIPTNGMLIGSGNNTILRLADSVTTGYAVKLLTYGCVKDMVIQGAQTSILSSSDNVIPTVGTRHGVLFEGTANAQSNPVTYYRSAVENCMIRWFTGGGITLNNTGTVWSSCLIISDCFIYRCGAGINIPYSSEFSRICNVSVQECYFGCIDNGGNNNFANCDFSANKVGILIDNSTGQSPNNSHGTFSGCTINHSYSDAGVMNDGTAIKLLGAGSGEIFTGLQLFFGGIVIDQCTGIRFIGSNIGRKVPITISNSNVISFSDSTFSQAPDHADSPFTQSGNTMLKFTDCYLHDGTVYNPMS